MPNRDGTGPGGKGSRTGRQMGKCEGANPGPGCSRLSSGRGRFRNRQNA
ncbi:DUF5320 domain-containing protein [Candidatus Woesearchaeota archaeon]|nr:DUF5320 domain-containing protein [Candidatus Woesearchaeota archaeon]